MVPRVDVAIIGGGVVGLYTALDLSLRGFSVAVLERGFIGSGTSGRMHGLLHSGARYAVRDPQAAVECARENEIIHLTAPHAVEDTGGLFVALEGDSEDYEESFSKALKSLGIKFSHVDPGEALKREPLLSPRIRSVYEVPDKVVRALDLLSSVALTAYSGGALIVERAEVSGFKISGESVEEILVTLRPGGRVVELRASLVVNASGPWAGRVARMAGAWLEVMPTAGAMAVYPVRLTRMVINRLRPPSDGDILVPYGSSSVLGTTARVVEDPDSFEAEEEDLEVLISEGSRLVPSLAEMRPSRIYYSVRPLVRTPGERPGREATRDFRIIAHERPRNMISAVGGKFTTARLEAEKISDEVSRLLGSGKRSTTKETRLLGSDPEEDLKDLGSELGEFAEALRTMSTSLDWERVRPSMYRIAVLEISRRSRKALGW